MYTKRLLTWMICSLFFLQSHSQVQESVVDVDIHSLGLYNYAQWKELVVYGKDKINSGIDFPLLRMRIGYAALMLGNFSQSLQQYQKVLDAEPDNYFALYYIYLNNLYLNNVAAARFYAAKLPAATKVSEKISGFKMSAIETEYSYKSTDNDARKDAQYARLGVNVQLGYRLELQQSVALWNQTISEPLLTSLINNTNININQKEYYAKLIFAAGGKVSLFGGFHYMNTPFNNLKYNNLIYSAGINYAAPFVHFQATAHLATLSDKTFNQYDGTVTLYPFGNPSLYSISKGAYGDDFTFSQIVGYGITKKIWLEGLVTLGSYTNLIDKDGLYIYNDIDRKKFRGGGSIYTALSKHLLLSLNYTFDQKTQYKPASILLDEINFNQHSINGGLSWKF